MIDDFLNRLSSANNSEERNWIITQDLLNTLPRDLTKLVWAGSIPHWFNTELLIKLRPELESNIENLYSHLQSLPFVEPYAGRGYNIHELTRSLMLRKLWEENRQEYTLLSQRAADYFSSQKQDFETAVEHFYNLLIANPQIANNILLKHMVKKASSLPRNQLTFAFKKMILEHVEAGRLAQS